MGLLCRFKTGDNVRFKARIYERSSRRHDCVVCGEKKFGTLVRDCIAPKRKDVVICHDCIVRLAWGVPIDVDSTGTTYGRYNIKELTAAVTARRRPKRKAGPKAKSGPKKKAVAKKTATLSKKLITGTKPVESEDTTNEPKPSGHTQRPDEHSQALPQTRD